MKKILIVLSCLFISANADFLRVEGGVGIFKPSISGDVGYKNDSYDIENELGFSNDSKAYAWFMFKHFIPIVPNLRLEYAHFGSSGKTKKDIMWGDKKQNVSASSDFDLTQVDFILYYNLLDDTFLATVDLGLDIRLLKGDLTIGDEKADIDLALPLPYVRARVNLPFSNLGLEASAAYIKYDGSSVSDINLKVDYAFDLIALDVGVEAGYKMQKNTFDTDSDLDGNVDFKGFFTGLIVKF